jgi:hypothetical protein
MDLIKTQEQILWVPLSAADLSDIGDAAKKRGTLNTRTLIKGEGNFAGFAGERLLKHFVPTLHDETDNPQWDFKTPSGITIDVKSKGNCKHVPELDFDCTVPAYQVKAQTCQYYVFTSIAKDMSGGWLLGFIEKERFEKEAEFRGEGSRYNNAGRVTVGNHRVILIHRLYPMRSMDVLMK